VVITVEDYAEIRKLFNSGISKRAIARKLNISRNTVDKYCQGNTAPWNKKEYTRQSTIISDHVMNFIEQCLAEDEREGIRKQKHTAKRIFDRLVDEYKFIGGESTVRRTVNQLKVQVQKPFIPLEFSPGEALQIDWGTAKIYLNGHKMDINLFCAKLCASGAPIVFAFERQNEESFLEALVRTFQHFGGITRRVVFDNAKVAVKDGFGSHAIKQARYTALAAHYGFETVFCNPAEGHEKGLVEGLVGWSRRNILVPIPRVESLEELNVQLLDRCNKYLNHIIRGKTSSVGTLLTFEKAALMKLPSYIFDTSHSLTTYVDSYCTIRFDTNNYSVPVAHCGHEVAVKGFGTKVIIYYHNAVIAKHNRCYGKKQTIYDLAHYLPLLEKRPRAVLNAKPVRYSLPPDIVEWLASLPVKEVMKALNLCVELGINTIVEAKRQGIPLDALCTKPQSSNTIIDVITVKPIDLSLYDRMLRKKAVL